MSILNDNKVENKLKEIISTKKNFFITRLGGTDWQLFVDIYNNNGKVEEKHYNTDYKLIFKYAGYYDKSTDNKTRKENMEKWYFNFKNAVIKADHHFVGGRDYNIVWTKGTAKTTPVVDNNFEMSSFGYVVELLEKKTLLFDIFPLFENKKILIISPFGNDICKNYNKNKDLIFKNFTNILGDTGIKYSQFKYPNFKSIDYVELFITNNDSLIRNSDNSWSFINNTQNHCPHNNFSETINVIKEELKKKDFDIALIGGGAYTQELGIFIKEQLNKGAFYFGGALQCYFGIKGRRYLPKYGKYMNNGWVNPNIDNLSPYLKSLINKGPTEAMGAYFV